MWTPQPMVSLSSITFQALVSKTYLNRRESKHEGISHTLQATPTVCCSLIKLVKIGRRGGGTLISRPVSQTVGEIRAVMLHPEDLKKKTKRLIRKNLHQKGVKCINHSLKLKTFFSSQFLWITRWTQCSSKQLLWTFHLSFWLSTFYHRAMFRV